MSIRAIGAQTQAVSALKTQKDAETKTAKTQSPWQLDKVTIRDKNLAFRLYSQKTLEKLNEVTQDAAAQLGVDPNTFDPSPESVSDFIAGFAIGAYSIYRKQHPELSEEEALNKYEKLIGGAIQKGYDEAIGILQGLGVNDEQTMSRAQQTHDLVFRKLGDFFDARRAELTESQD
jgi:hypothetical protein